MKVEIGDWIAFYSGGRIVIGEVRYLAVRFGGRVEFQTSIGCVSEDGVLEVRPAKEADDD